MKDIQTLVDRINEELDDAKTYVVLASEQKDRHRSLAEVFFTLSQDELRHSMTLHNEVVKLIDEYRKTEGEPPADMLAIYDYLHKLAIAKQEKIKRLQQIYNG